MIFKPLYKCFIHTLRAVNPEEAVRVEASPPQPRRSGKASRADRRASESVPLPHIESNLSGPYRVRRLWSVVITKPGSYVVPEALRRQWHCAEQQHG